MINNSGYATMDKAHMSDIQKMISKAIVGISGYDAEKTQIPRHISGVLTWVDETTQSGD